MSVSENNRAYLEILGDIYEVSQECSTVTYMWGGIAVDVLKGRFMREHHDIDGFCLNLLECLTDLETHYRSRGYVSTFDRDFQILRIENSDCRHPSTALRLTTRPQCGATSVRTAPSTSP